LTRLWWFLSPLLLDRFIRISRCADGIVIREICAPYYTYPDEYKRALFWVDYTRGRIRATMPTAANGLPNPNDRRTFVAQASAPVDLAIGPGGDLSYVDATGSVRRIRHFSGNQPPVAVIRASPTSGPAPLNVSFNGTGSYDADHLPRPCHRPARRQPAGHFTEVADQPAPLRHARQLPHAPAGRVHRCEPELRTTSSVGATAAG
jgi:hypothetical protein